MYTYVSLFDAVAALICFLNLLNTPAPYPFFLLLNYNADLLEKKFFLMIMEAWHGSKQEFQLITCEAS